MSKRDAWCVVRGVLVYSIHSVSVKNRLFNQLYKIRWDKTRFVVIICTAEETISVDLSVYLK